MFSVGGSYYYGEPIDYSYIEDRIFEHSRNVSIKLHHRIGRFVKLQLHFAARWIMISEVTFDSGEYQCSYDYRLKRLDLNRKYELLRQLPNRNSKLSIENKLTLYKTILKPTWTYGIEL
ncbi:hypothetical protein AAG570_004591 [Ranatra chinensis]|uniref:Discoidin domain-containing protein n=1 Tax=Ranatra chinensis TaxID=642074 RepID=A0ABD0Y3K8_9HEMI